MEEYRTGTEVEGARRPEVSGLYRPLLPWIWALGGVLLFLAGFLGWGEALTVVIVTHIFFAGLIRADIKSMRKQGLDWGKSRHLWFGAALGLPFVVPAYYYVSGRKVRRANRERGYLDETEDQE